MTMAISVIWGEVAAENSTNFMLGLSLPCALVARAQHPLTEIGYGRFQEIPMQCFLLEIQAGWGRASPSAMDENGKVQGHVFLERVLRRQLKFVLRSTTRGQRICTFC